jgi:hypothetical protein
MYSQNRPAGRFSFVLGYALTQFAIVAGAATFPSSNVWLVLSFVEVGAFFVVAIPVFVMVHLVSMRNFFTAFRRFGRRIRFGAVELLMTGKPSLLRKDLESQEMNAGLWDRWIDGSCEVPCRSQVGKNWWSDGSSYF